MIKHMIFFIKKKFLFDLGFYCTNKIKLGLKMGLKLIVNKLFILLHNIYKNINMVVRTHCNLNKRWRHQLPAYDNNVTFIFLPPSSGKSDDHPHVGNPRPNTCILSALLSPIGIEELNEME
ncbi:hypothetical protein PYW08_010865 [Mythimna loreyi]|uniref:Uncharacterized protein n=1 Tax=Mythimna loreyi TaxID=667449 RepID=A0ACC2Q1X3_9NEOP|nr:hypothetical protein PYW08_010865 [Mythimna loreyi]